MTETQQLKRGRKIGMHLDTDGFAATLAEVRRLRKLGHTFRQIGEIMGMTRGGVAYYIDRFPDTICRCCGSAAHRDHKKIQPNKKHEENQKAV